MKAQAFDSGLKKYQPTGDRILIRCIDRDESVAGIKIVRTDNEEVKYGEVVARGENSPLTIGQGVLYHPGAGTIVRIMIGATYEEFRICHSNTIRCLIS